MKSKILLSIMACLFLFMGGLIYLCFRSPTLLLFKWLDFIGFKYLIFQNVNIKLPAFFIYNFTNALFVMFGYIFVYVIWDKDKFHYFLYTFLITFLSIVYEIITKDFSDIITIFVTFIICLFLYNINYGVNYEK
jgi:hypothetical protein